MDQPLTVILPMHNRERQVRSSVQDILDLSTTVSPQINVVIVDDGSTDDTYEVACEVARQYPQVTVLRQSIRQGMGAALDLVRHRLSVEMVLVHDGISVIDASQIQALSQTDELEPSSVEKVASPNTSTMESSGSRRFAGIRDVHDRMEQAHRTVTSFRWIQLEKPLVPRRRQTAAPTSQGPAATTFAPISLTSIPAVPTIVPGS